MLLVGDASTTYTGAWKAVAGEMFAVQFTCAETGIVNELQFRTNATANTGVTKVFLALFGDADGEHPASVMGSGEVVGLPAINTWVTLTGLSVQVIKGTKYWLVALPIGGEIHFNEAAAPTAKTKASATGFTKIEGNRWAAGGGTFGPVGFQALGSANVPATVKPLIGLHAASGYGAGPAAKVLAKNIKSDRVELWTGYVPKLSTSQGYGFINISGIAGQIANEQLLLSEVNVASWTTLAVEEIEAARAKGVQLIEVINEPYLIGQSQPASYAALYMSLANAVDAAHLTGIKLLFPSFGTYKKIPLGSTMPGYPLETTYAAGQIFAAQFTAAETATIKQIELGTGATANTATSVMYGIYEDSAGKPGALLGSGTEAGTPPANGKNGPTITSVAVTAGTKYWLAAVPLGGNIHVLHAVASGGSNMIESAAAGHTTLEATTWKAATATGPTRMIGVAEFTASLSRASEGHGWLGDAVAAQPGLLTRVDGFVAHPYGRPGENRQESEGPGAMLQQHLQTETLGFTNRNFFVTEFGVKIEAVGPISEPTEAGQAKLIKEIMEEFTKLPWVKGIWYYQSHDTGAEKWGLFEGATETERESMATYAAFAPGEFGEAAMPTLPHRISRQALFRSMYR